MSIASSRSVNTNDKGEKLTFTLKHDSPALARVTVTSDSPATANVVGSGDAACHETASKGCVFVVDAILMPSNVADQLPAGTVESAISNTSEYKYVTKKRGRKRERERERERRGSDTHVPPCLPGSFGAS